MTTKKPTKTTGSPDPIKLCEVLLARGIDLYSGAEKTPVRFGVANGKPLVLFKDESWWCPISEGSLTLRYVLQQFEEWGRLPKDTTVTWARNQESRERAQWDKKRLLGLRETAAAMGYDLVKRRKGKK